MTKETISKLLLSSCKEDVILGLNFLKNYTVETILEEFKELVVQENLNNSWFGAKIVIETMHKVPSTSYFKINDRLLCCIEGGILIFRDPVVKYNTGYRIIDL